MRRRNQIDNEENPFYNKVNALRISPQSMVSHSSQI